MKFSRFFATSRPDTFNMPPVTQLLLAHNVGNDWADPFAGWSSFAEWRNDIRPEMKQPHCYDALEFCKMLPTDLVGVLIDPPYSNRQISEHYKSVGKKATSLDTSGNFYARIFDELAPRVSKVINFGWNSNGFGKLRGFQVVEIMLVHHGASKNDTIVTVEERRC